MVKNVSILGSTGSIGRQSLDIISRMPGVKVSALTASSSVELMAEQRPGGVTVYADCDGLIQKFVFTPV